jgi:hypothetical protein
VNLSDLQNPTKKQISGDLYIQVASCSDFSDSRKVSDSVIKSKQTIPSIFKDAQYVECFQKEFISYSHFTVPILLSTKNTITSNDYIHIISNKDNLLSVGVPPSIKQNLDRIKANSFGMTDIDLSVSINFKNDTNKKLIFNAIASYVGNEPSIYNNYFVEPNHEFSIKLSDVSVDNALINGVSQVLTY